MGSAAVDYLAGKVHLEDPGESSHWRTYHSSFRFQDGRFEGLRGFGGSEPPPRGWRALGHRLLQRPFRSLGAAYPDFPAIDALARRVTRDQGRAYDLDVLRQSLTLAFLRRHVPGSLPSGAMVAVIGDGFASMTSLLIASETAGKVCLINLTKTLLVDLWYLRLWMGADRFASEVAVVTDEAGLTAALAAPGVRVVGIEALNHTLLQLCPVDTAINIVSMQEMDPPVINAYFEDLYALASRRPVAFYCCNREEKTLPDGTVTRFADYPWRPSDTVLIDELCPWHQQHYGFRPPFYFPYDGPIRHRLTILHASTD